jgi:hypothetical protein
MSWIITGTQKYPVGSMWSMTVNASDSSFSLITNAACDLGIDWGDGVNETISIAGGVQTTTHTYASSGTYVIRFTVTGGNLVPYYNNNAEAQKITALGSSQYDWSFGASLERAWYGGSNITLIDAGMDTSGVTSFGSTWRKCSRLTSFPLIDTSAGTIFGSAWSGCSSLTSFPLIDTSAGTSFSGAWENTSLTSFPLIDTSSGTTFFQAWNNCSSLTSFPLINTSAGTNFVSTWRDCSSLTSFPLIDTSAGTLFGSAWRDCSSLTSFPLIDTSAGTLFGSAWSDCSSLTSFPLIDTSAGTNFSGAWSNCSSLTSFPLIDTSSGTTFWQAWIGCSSLTTFPANFFDSWAGTPINNCFYNTWNGCSSLTATSVENILNSIDTSGQSAPASGVDITIDYDAGTGTPSVSTAVTNLKSRGWTITLNGVAQ